MELTKEILDKVEAKVDYLLEKNTAVVRDYRTFFNIYGDKKALAIGKIVMALNPTISPHSCESYFVFSLSVDNIKLSDVYEKFELFDQCCRMYEKLQKIDEASLIKEKEQRIKNLIDYLDSRP